MVSGKMVAFSGKFDEDGFIEAVKSCGTRKKVKNPVGIKCVEYTLTDGQVSSCIENDCIVGILSSDYYARARREHVELSKLYNALQYVLFMREFTLDGFVDAVVNKCTYKVAVLSKSVFIEGSMEIIKSNYSVVALCKERGEDVYNALKNADVDIQEIIRLFIATDTWRRNRAILVGDSLVGKYPLLFEKNIWYEDGLRNKTRSFRKTEAYAKIVECLDVKNVCSNVLSGMLEMFSASNGDLYLKVYGIRREKAGSVGRIKWLKYDWQNDRYDLSEEPLDKASEPFYMILID